MNRKKFSENDEKCINFFTDLTKRYFEELFYRFEPIDYIDYTKLARSAIPKFVEQMQRYTKPRLVGLHPRKFQELG